MASRPSFNSAWNAFMAVLMPVEAVGKKIGGYVQKNIETPEDRGGFANACPIRMSYVLNTTGFPIRKSPLFSSVSGADHRQYLYKVPDMMRYLEYVFGKPDKTVRSPKPSDFSGQRGILVVRGHGWKNAVGHVTLWNGRQCSDSCHLLGDPNNSTFVPDSASIWLLP